MLVRVIATVLIIFGLVLYAIGVLDNHTNDRFDYLPEKQSKIDYFRISAEKDYVNGTSQSVLGGEYGTEIGDIACGDLDLDGELEYVTISKDVSLGMFAWISAGGVNLRVWKQSGSDLKLIDDVTWEGNRTAGGYWGSEVEIYQLEPSSANLEIITLSKNNIPTSSPDNPKRNGYIKVWSWTNSQLSLITEISITDPMGGDTLPRAMAISDIDKDGKIEICAVGNLSGHPSGSASFLAICEYSSNSLTLEKFESWCGDAGGGALAFGVSTCDFDGDGKEEIVTVGARVKTYPDGYTQAGEIRVWKYDGNSLTTITYTAWDSTIGNEMGRYANRLIKDVLCINKNIFVISIAEAGYRWGEITCWKFDGNNLAMTSFVTFLYDIQSLGMAADTTFPMSMCIADIDNNLRDEIVVCGGTGNQNFMAYFIAVFDYSGTLSERCHSVWYDLVTPEGSGVNCMEGIDAVVLPNKDKVCIAGVYVEPKQSPMGSPSGCKHGRIFILEYTGEPGVFELPLSTYIAVVLSLCYLILINRNFINFSRKQ